MLRRPRRMAVLAAAAVVASLVPALVASPASAVPSPGSTVLFNELHYDNVGTDVGEFVEVAGPVGTDLTGWRVVPYNGGSTPATAAAAVAYAPEATLSGAVPAAGVLAVDLALQNGAPDGLALVDASGGLVQFLSYEGELTAADGPAAGRTSTDIGVQEAGTEPAGQSLQLAGTGRTYGDFTWARPAAATRGSINSNQTLNGAAGPAARAAGDADCLAPATALTPVSQVQGSGPATSVPATQTVQVEGVVVADLDDVEAGGFFLQSLVPDGDPATSEGLFVASPATATVALGEIRRAAGLVAERSGLTTLVADDTDRCGAAPMPAATPLPVPSDDATRERLEGMRVTPGADLTVTELFNLDRFGELVLAAGRPQVQPTEAARPGSATATALMAANPLGRITLDDGRSAPDLRPVPYLTRTDPVRIGDRVDAFEDVVLSVGFGAWRLQPADGDARNPGSSTFAPTNPRPAAPAAVGGTYEVGAFNVLNYFTTIPSGPGPRDPRGARTAEDLAEQEAKIVAAINLLGVDVVALQEIENSFALGEAKDEALATLVRALNTAAGAGTWDYVRSPANLPPAEEQDVITNALIFKPARVQLRGPSVAAVDAPGTPADQQVFDNAREPIAQTFVAAGDAFTVVANHLKSKGGTGTGANADQRDGQGSFNADRVGQARAVLAFAERLRSDTGDSDVLLMGDFNAYTQEDPVEVLRQGGFRDLVETRKPGDYSYVFDGQLGSLDHALASIPLSQKVTGVDVWNINSPESDAYEYDGVPELFTADVYRSSDHDPVVVGLDLGVRTVTPYDVQVLGINDFHGRLQPPVAARGGAPSRGGAAFLATAVQQFRDEVRNTVLVSAGDNIGATPFASAVQQDAPAIAALDAMGLEVTSVGNHEFDRGYVDLAGRVASLAGFPFLGANVVGETPELPSTHTVTLADGVTVGMIGVTTEQTGTLVSPDGIRGITFADIVATVNDAAAVLTDGNAANGEADVLVLMAHEGPGTAAATPEQCETLRTRQDAFGAIARDVTAKVDAIIAGHTHQVVDCEIALPVRDRALAKGTVRPVLEAGEYGQFLDRLRFTWNPTTRTLTDVRTEAVPITSAAFTADPVVQRLVDDAVRAAAEVGKVPVGRIAEDVLRGRAAGGAVSRSVESVLVNLVADVQLAATQGPGLGGAQIAFMNPGGVRTDLLFASSPGGEGDGVVTYAEAAELQPFANGVVTVTLTGAQVKQVLEEQYRLSGTTVDFLALGVSRGFRYEFLDSAAAGDRIRSITLNGAPLVATTDYRVTVNSFLAGGGDAFPTLALGRNRQDNGFNDLDVLVEFLKPTLTGTPLTPAKDDRAVPFTGQATPTPTATITPSPAASSPAPASPAPSSPAPSTPAASGSPSPVGCSVVPSVVLERDAIVATTAAGVSVRGPVGASVDLWAYTRPSTTFRVVRSGVIGAGGTVGFAALRPPANTRLYAQVRGCTTDPVAGSVVLSVRTALSLSAQRTGRRSYVFSGDSLPARPGGVLVSLYRVERDGRQVLTAQTRASAATGEWRIARRFTGAGRFGFVVRTQQDLRNAAGVSNVRPTVVF